jgi:hypothetical protein
LQDFDLLDHARGIDGPLYCMMAFGFSMEDAGSVMCINAPRPRYAPVPFEVPDGAQGITFAFGQWVFDFMRAEWATLGLPEFDKELDVADELDALSISKQVQTALARLKVCREPSGKPGLGVRLGPHQYTIRTHSPINISTDASQNLTLWLPLHRV